MIGTNIGNYAVTAIIGEGGMGSVYLAEHSLLGRRAAVKVLRPELSDNSEVVARFFNEARALTALRHPSIVEILDFGYLPDGSAYIVMEYLEGEDLGERCRRLDRFEPQTALVLVRQIAGALLAAHERNIIHRDLKPENIFLVHDPEVSGGERIKVLDFGIAKLAIPGGRTRTQTGSVLGTPTYMSPEQCRGAGGGGVVDARADLYALGCVLFEMLCGRPPFEAEAIGELIAHHLYFAPPAPRSLDASIPETVEQLILWLLEKEPAARPQTARDVIDVIDRIYQYVPSAASGPTPRPSETLRGTYGAAASQGSITPQTMRASPMRASPSFATPAHASPVTSATATPVPGAYAPAVLTPVPAHAQAAQDPATPVPAAAAHSSPVPATSAHPSSVPIPAPAAFAHSSPVPAASGYPSPAPATSAYSSPARISPAHGSPVHPAPADGSPMLSPAHGSPVVGSTAHPSPAHGSPTHSPGSPVVDSAMHSSPVVGSVAHSSPVVDSIVHASAAHPSPAPGSPMLSPAYGSPVVDSAVHASAAHPSPAPGSPTHSPAHGSPVVASAMHSSPAHPVPADGSPMLSPAHGSPVVGSSAHPSPAPGSPTHSPAHGSPVVGSPAHGSPVVASSSADGSPTHSPAHGSPVVASSPDGSPMHSPAHGSPVVASSPADGSRTRSPAFGLSVDAKFAEFTPVPGAIAAPATAGPAMHGEPVASAAAMAAVGSASTAGHATTAPDEAALPTSSSLAGGAVQGSIAGTSTRRGTSPRTSTITTLSSAAGSSSAMAGARAARRGWIAAGVAGSLIVITAAVVLVVGRSDRSSQGVSRPASAVATPPEPAQPPPSAPVAKPSDPEQAPSAPADPSPTPPAPAPAPVDKLRDSQPTETPATEEIAITINSVPPRANVIFDGKNMGRTPFVDTVAPISGERVYTLQKTGYEPATVTVASDRANTLLVTLKKKPRSRDSVGDKGVNPFD